MIGRKIHYSGRVQGVGFRVTTKHVASRFPVTGYVQNLPNGDVEVVAFGTAAAIDEFLADLDRTMAGYIENRRIEDEPVREFGGFSIVP